MSVTAVIVLGETLKPGPSEQESSGVQAVFRSLVGYLRVSLSWVQQLACGTTVCYFLLLGVANGGLCAVISDNVHRAVTRAICCERLFFRSRAALPAPVFELLGSCACERVSLLPCFLRWGKQITLLMAIRAGVGSGSIFNPPLPSGHYMYHHSTILRSACTVYLCVLCGSENKQRLFPYTTLIGWFL